MLPLIWVVGPADGRTVGEVLARAGVDGSAVSEGRVFVARRRIERADEAVRVGDELSIAPPRKPLAGKEHARILLHSGDVVAVDKPAGIPTIPDQTGSAHALVTQVARALGVDARRVHPTSRLDRGVSGVVFFALTRDAAARLARARAEGTYERRYIAIAARAPEPSSGTWNAPIGRAHNPRLREVGGRDPAPAATRFAAVASATTGETMLAVEPITGRTHQIRVHAGHAGAPLLGDREYGGPARVTLPNGRVIQPRRIALHAAHVVIREPSSAALLEARAAIPTELLDLWSALGGEAGAWEAGACRAD